MTSDLLYLTHILECIEKIEQFTADGKELFASDMKTQDAVLRNLHILSESSTRISQEVQQQNPDVPWREMRAFRNVVVHDYLGLELNQVWDIIVIDLPPVKNAIFSIVKKLH